VTLKVSIRFLNFLAGSEAEVIVLQSRAIGRIVTMHAGGLDSIAGIGSVKAMLSERLKDKFS
jgi:hypothetical protein